MIRLILLTDFTETFSYNLLKGILAYSKSHDPWVVCTSRKSAQEHNANADKANNGIYFFIISVLLIS